MRSPSIFYLNDPQSMSVVLMKHLTQKASEDELGMQASYLCTRFILDSCNNVRVAVAL